MDESRTKRPDIETRRRRASRRPRGPGLLVCLILAAGAHGCLFRIERFVPEHGNSGDLVALRDADGARALPEDLFVLFGGWPSPRIPFQSPVEIVAEIPGQARGVVPVSVWHGLQIISNVKAFQIDTVPLQYHILAFGDSLVGPWIRHPQMLDEMLNEDVAPCVVINEGNAGEVLAKGAERLPHVLAVHEPLEVLYILQGANDVTDATNTPLDDMLAALQEMLALAETHSIRPILLTLPPRTRNALAEDQMSPTTEEWNDLLRAFTVENQIDLVDIYQAFVAEPDWESLLVEDGLHFNEEGQRLVAETVYAAMVPLLQ